MPTSRRRAGCSGVGNSEVQSPGSGKSPVVLAESQKESLSLRPAIVWGAAVKGRELVMLPRGFPLLLAMGFYQLTIGSTTLGIGLAQTQPGFRGVDAIITFDPRVVPNTRSRLSYW